jgi:PAS domain S-box-containing protein
MSIPAAVPDLQEWTARYTRVLRECDSAVPSDRALGRARSLGEDALDAGVRASQLVEAHAEALLKCSGIQALPSRSDWTTRVLLESLGPFDAVHRDTGDIAAALGATRQRYGELVEHANDVIFGISLDGHLVSLNRAGERLLGCTREDACGLPIDDLLTSLKVKRSFQKYRRGRSALGRRHCEVDIFTRDGRTVPLEVNLAPTLDNGVTTGIQGIARDITHRKQVEFALRHLNQRLEERAKRIAHALHDEAGQLLTSVYLKVAEIAQGAEASERTSLAELRTLLDQVSEQLRHLAHELRPSVLDDLGLIAACEFLGDGIARRFGVVVDVFGSTGGRLPSNVETALYRVSQEALTNGIKHGRASRLALEFRRRGHAIEGRIWDDGIGFDVRKTMTSEHRRDLGLAGMRHRLVELGGQLSIKSRLGHGTTIEFEVPLGGPNVGVSATGG